MERKNRSRQAVRLGAYLVLVFGALSGLWMNPGMASAPLAEKPVVASPLGSPAPILGELPVTPVSTPAAPASIDIKTPLPVKEAVVTPASPAPLATAVPGILRDISYRQVDGVDPHQLSLDIYVPAGASRSRVVVFVHGGGWSGGDKADVARKDRLFTNAGYVFVSINYRLLPQGQHPTNARDVAAAFAWVHDNIARYGGDPDRIYAIGHSAGAHLAGLVATDERFLRGAGKDLHILRGVVLLDSNAYNIPLLMPRLGREPNVYAGAFGQQESALWREASPATHVAPGKGIPPFLVVWANNDHSRHDQADSMAGRLRNAGVSAEIVAIPDRDHVTLCDLIGQPGDATTTAILNFIAR